MWLVILRCLMRPWKAVAAVNAKLNNRPLSKLCSALRLKGNIVTGQLTRHCGFIAIIGRPNVGKSTLLNHLLGQKISITSRKPQTTRHRVLGIKTEADHQIIFVDTPGLHKEAGKAINRYMNRAASAAIRDVDVVVFVVDRTAWTEEDNMVLEQIKQGNLPVVLVVNKIDLLEDKSALL